MSSAQNNARALAATIDKHMSTGSLDDHAFSELARRVFHFQYEHNTAYHHYCKAKRISPKNLKRWQDIPAAPTDAFKSVAHPLTCFPLEHANATFLTSGTTTEKKGQHHFPSLDLYETSIISAWRERSLPLPSDFIFLTPSPQNAPHSSLSHMMGVLAEHFSNITNPDSSGWAIKQSGELDVNMISAASNSEQPVAILGTALAFLHLFDRLPAPLNLPPGSWVLETGGYKGTKRSISKEGLYQLFTEHLGIPPDSIINEYSMTELSSQFYTSGLGQPHHGPSWTRTRIIDPRTGTDAQPGEPGHLVIYDLANLYSVMAISTQDLAIQTNTGLAEDAPSFTLLGRDPSALPRGCSRSIDSISTPS